VSEERCHKCLLQRKLTNVEYHKNEQKNSATNNLTKINISKYLGKE
jgi:hypothetical protein